MSLLIHSYARVCVYRKYEPPFVFYLFSLMTKNTIHAPLLRMLLHLMFSTDPPTPHVT